MGHPSHMHMYVFKLKELLAQGGNVEKSIFIITFNFQINGPRLAPNTQMLLSIGFWVVVQVEVTICKHVKNLHTSMNNIYILA